MVQGREAALTALYAAVVELARLAPDDPVAVTLRQSLAGLRNQTNADEVRSVAWF